eukprot:9951271-Karenia_brevis.AAC.1
MHRFSCKGTTKWRTTLLRLSQHYKDRYHLPLATFTTTYDNLSSSAPSVFFCCPCGHSRQATQQVFSVTTPSRAVWCLTCRKSWGGRKWVCACGKSWAECPVHYNSVPVGLIAKKRKPSPLPTSADTSTSNAKRARIDIHNPRDHLVFQLRGKLAQKFGHLQ